MYNNKMMPWLNLNYNGRQKAFGFFGLISQDWS